MESKKIITKFVDKANNEIDVVEFFDVKGIEYPIKSINGDGGGATFSSKEHVFEVELVGSRTSERVEKLYSVKYIDSALEEMQKSIDSNKELIATLKQDVADRELPIGTVIVAVEAPSYGVWTHYGLIDKGQTIVGGWSTNGSNLKHDHEYWRADMTTTQSIKSGTDFKGISFASSTVVGDGSDDKNRAWGMGFGNDKNMFIRES